MTDLDQIRTDISNTLDTRKLQQLIDDGVIGHKDLAEAPIVFVCSGCNYEQPVDNDICSVCQRDIR